MHIGKSCRQAMFDKSMKAADVAVLAKMSIDRVYQLRRTRVSATCDSIDRLAKAFGMKVSEFIALGE